MCCPVLFSNSIRDELEENNDENVFSMYIHHTLDSRLMTYPACASPHAMPKPNRTSRVWPLNGPNLTSESTGAYTKGTTNFSKARCFLRSFNLSMSSGVIFFSVLEKECFLVFVKTQKKRRFTRARSL